jgi:apolipoprotein N-acyltransferase
MDSNQTLHRQPAVATMKRLFERPAFLLGVGCALIVGANFRWGVGVLAWIAPVPLLRYLRLTDGWRYRLAFAAALCFAWIATTLKIVTAPLPVVAAVAMGLLAAIFNLAAYLAWDGARRRAPQGAALLAFPTAVIATEWLAHFTPLASWGAMAYTQVDNLPLVQLVSVGGIAAISFIVAWVAAWLELALSNALAGTSGRLSLRQGIAVAAIFLVAHVWGVMRLNTPLDDVSVRVATVSTRATFGGAPPLPDAAARNAIVDTLLRDSAQAATAGARLVVWTEAAALVLPGEEEAGVLHRVADLARVHNVDIVAAYVVPASQGQTLPYQNEYRWFGPDGVQRQAYWKHHPAPGEPAVVGHGPLTVIDTSFGRASGAICYDYDYPEVPLEHARLGVDVVALPSSDWRGIDPLHAQMAALGAVAGGFSLVRSTRFGLSAIIDPLGRMRGWHSSFEGGARILIAEVPRQHLNTVYASIGDVLVYTSMAFLIGLTGWGAISRRAGARSDRESVG